MFHGSFSQELDGATSPDIERVMWPYLWQKGVSTTAGTY